MQLDFWSEFSKFLEHTSFRGMGSARDNYYYLPVGTRHAKIVLTAPTDDDRLACKLALTPRAVAEVIYESLYDEREAIEAELGDLGWGTGQSDTRIYRYRRGGIENRSAWIEAFEWLLDSAEKFKEVFVPRVRQVDLSGPQNRTGNPGANPPFAPRPRTRGRTPPTAANALGPGRDRSVETPDEQSPSRLVTDTERAIADAFAGVDALGPWSEWMPLAEACALAPLLPGVYLARSGRDGSVIYVGHAGERRVSGLGIRGRLSAYRSGKGLVSGLGEAAFDRALADPAWLSERAAEVESGNARRAKEWGKEAIVRADLQVRWLVSNDKAEALALERKCQCLLAGTGLWNRQA